MLPRGDRNAVGHAIGNRRVGDLVHVLRELHLEHVAEAARSRPFDAGADAPELVHGTEIGEVDAFGARDVADIVLDPAARLDRPALAGADPRRALEADVTLGLARLLGVSGRSDQRGGCEEQGGSFAGHSFLTDNGGPVTGR